MNKQLKAFILFLFLGLLLRIVISYFQYSGDIKNHLVWANGFISNPLGFYDKKFPGFNDPNYPPLAIILFGASHLFYSFCKWVVLSLNSFPLFPSSLVPLMLSENIVFAFLKLPSIISDVVLAWLIYKSLQKKAPKTSFFFSLLFLFNPAVIYVSSVWGQIESITMLFLFLSFQNQSSSKSLFYFTLATLTKQTALWLLPFYLLIWLKNINFMQLVKGSLIAFLTFFGLYLPFSLSPYSAISSYFATLSGSSTVVSDAAWNLWYFLLPLGTNDNYQVLGLSIRFISIVSLVALLFCLLVKHWNSKVKDNIANTLFFWSFFVFFLQTRVHERHLYPALVFLLVSTFGFLPKTILFIILSIFYYLNLSWSLRLPFI